MSGRFGATSSHSSAAPQSRGLATDWPSRRRDYVLEDRYADGDASRMPLLAEELVRLKPDVIVTATTPGVLAAKQATASIPIVAVNITDAVGFGLAASEARPGANVTGILFRVEGLTGKLVEIARDLIPGMEKMGVLVDITTPAYSVRGARSRRRPLTWQ